MWRGSDVEDAAPGVVVMRPTHDGIIAHGRKVNALIAWRIIAEQCSMECQADELFLPLTVHQGASTRIAALDVAMPVEQHHARSNRVEGDGPFPRDLRNFLEH